MKLTFSDAEVEVLDDDGELMHRGPSAELLHRLVNGLRHPPNQAVTTGLLPARTVWINPTGTAVIFERPPSMYHCYFHPGTADIRAEAVEYDIALPWQVYGITFTPRGEVSNLLMYARNSPIMGVQDPLFVLPIPNTDTTATACLGLPFVRHYRRVFGDAPELAPLGERIACAVNTFWSGTFNNDIIGWCQDWMFPAQVSDQIRNAGQPRSGLMYLQLLTTVDRATVMRWDFQPSNVSGSGHDTIEWLQHELLRIGGDPGGEGLAPPVEELPEPQLLRIVARHLLQHRGARRLRRIRE